MLDVHPPHSPTHTWKDFFLHIATITVGLLVAVGIEQTVEFFHHRHQAEQTVEALRSEAVENQSIARADFEWLASMIEAQRANRDALRSAAVNHGYITPQWHQPPARSGWLPLVDSAWLTARDSAIFSLLPANLVRDRWRIEFYIQQTNESGVACFNSIFAMRSKLYQHGSEIRLTPAESDDMIRELTSIDGELRHLYSTTQNMSSANDLYLQQLEINHESLRKQRETEAKPPSW